MCIINTLIKPENKYWRAQVRLFWCPNTGNNLKWVPYQNIWRQCVYVSTIYIFKHLKGPGTALIETEPFQVYTNENYS